MPSIEDARHLPVFAALPDDQWEYIRSLAQPIVMGSGDVLLREGDAAVGMFVLVAGELELLKQVNGQPLVVSRQQPGSIVGEIAVLTNAPEPVTVRVTQPSLLLKFSTSVFGGQQNSPISRLLFATIVERLRATEAMVQQHARLEALAQMAAGLAHHLNNPASASLRAAKQLPETLGGLYQLVFRFQEFNLSADQLQFLGELQSKLLACGAPSPTLQPLERSDREEQITQALELHGVTDGWRYAPMLAAAGIDEPTIERLSTTLETLPMNDALHWLEGMVRLNELMGTLEQSAARIVDMVHSVMAYAYTDLTPLQTVDVHTGLENTLSVLEHRMEGITVERDYDRSLPMITVYGSELNQVWTSLLENAIEAVRASGGDRIGIRTWRESDWLIVEIMDSGGGIPADVLPRIFEPFFTTKPIGQGAGLGLTTAYRIVHLRHRGQIRVVSSPGETRFQVCLPMFAQYEE